MSFSASVAVIVTENANGLLGAHESWARVPLGLVFDIQNGFPFESKCFNASGKGVPLLRIRDVMRGETETFYDGPYDHNFLVQPGDILVGMDGDFNVRRWRGPAALLNQRVCRLIPKGLYPAELLPLVLQGYLDAINAKTSSITVKHLSSKTIEEVPLPLPPPVERSRLVDAIQSYLSRLDAAVATLEAAQRKLKAYRSSVLNAAVAGRLVPTEAALARAEKRDFEPADVLLKRILSERRRRWEEAELAKLRAAGKSPKDDKWKAKYEEPRPPDTKGLPKLPEGWCWATLPMLGELNRGKSKHRPRNDPRLLDGPYPFVQTGDVRNADTWVRTFDATYSEFGLAQSRLWPVGTMCITIAANIAETAILTFDACFPDSVVGFLQEDALLTRYVELFLRTAKQRLDQYAPATAQKNINLEILSKVAVPLPPQDEQGRLVEEIERLLSVAAAATSSAKADEKRIARLRQSILKWAFEGKLVDQDPKDEPAEKLLQRIRAAREAAEPAKVRRRGKASP